MEKRKKTGELELFKEIWAERPHKCVICEANLPVFTVKFFAHVLSKGSHPEMRLDKENIEIMCFPHHYRYDAETYAATKDRRYDKIFAKKEDLKTKYNE
jgi:hypothetical protein